MGYATGTVATDGTSSWDNSTVGRKSAAAGGDGETVEGGENTGTATDDPNSTEGGEPTAPAVPVTDAPPASEEDGPGAIQAQSKAALTQVPVVKYGQRRRRPAGVRRDLVRPGRRASQTTRGGPDRPAPTDKALVRTRAEWDKAIFGTGDTRSNRYGTARGQHASWLFFDPGEETVPRRPADIRGADFGGSVQRPAR